MHTGRMLMLLASGDLDTCEGSIDRLVEAIELATTRAGMTWATE